ncbi:hypothetical protein KY389_11040 [Paracoccus bogoriensis]|uniref:hypothetical protein n=1 Tax=Paracoccus bogoriensis TaxID=242065 RepID=UPI001CA57AB7|nr:hypothetical protein [Paracoccus bogoriensis]MBW7057221.1 hypothetical protein [Paracoccus bogoriensis]
MPTIYDCAVRSFEAAAAVLMTLQQQRINLVAEAGRCLDGKPKRLLDEGYNALASRLGICIPEDARAEFAQSEDGKGLEFRNSGMTWMTFEGQLPETEAERTCYLDARATFPAPVIADVFLREFKADGRIIDSLHQEWVLGAHREALCSLTLPPSAKGVTGRRVIIHLRQPPLRFLIENLALTVV